MVRRFGKRSSKHGLNSSHKSCKLQNNWFKCDGLGKRHKYTYCQTLFPTLTSMRCTKKFSGSAMVSYRKSLLTPRPLLYCSLLTKALRRASTWRLHTKHYNFHWYLLPNNSSSEYSTSRNFGYFNFLIPTLLKSRNRNCPSLVFSGI